MSLAPLDPVHGPATAPGLTIIIATYNAARTLQRALDSVFAQDSGDWELVVVDGGSGDGTVGILRANADRIHYWHSASDRGIYDAWNQALRHARGRFVCFLGADDAFAAADSVRVLLAAAASGNFDLVSSRGWVEEDGRPPRSFGGAFDFQRLGRRMVVCHPGLLHRRSLFERYGGFDASFRIAGDLEFLLRLPADTPSLHLPVETVRIEGGGISRSNVLKRLREQRIALARSPRHGPIFAWLAWLDKLWRYPIARLLGLPH